MVIDKRAIERASSITSDTTVDLETAITKTGCGKFNWLIIMLTFPLTLNSVFVTGSMSFVISVAGQDLALTNSDKAMLQSAAYAGMVVSGYFWGFLSDAFGRKKLLVIGFFVNLFLNVGEGIIMSLPIILIFKFLSGFMICGPYSIYVVYMSEVFSRQHRDLVAQFMGVFTSLAGVIQTGIALWLIPMELPTWVPFKSWQLFAMFGGVPALLCGLGSFFFYESPKFLIEKGKTEKALTVCRSIFTINTGLPKLSYPVNKIQTFYVKPKKVPLCSRILTEIFDLFRPPYLWKALAAYTIFIILFASQNTLRLWMPEIFTLLQNSTITDVIGICPLIASEKGSLTHSKNLVPKESVYLNLAIMNCSCLIGHLLFMMLVNCIRKKVLLIIGVFIAGICIMIVPWVHADIVLLPISVFLALFEVGIYAFLGSIVQIFPTHLRGKSASLSLVLARAVVFVGNLLFSSLMYTQCDNIFYSLAALSFGSIVLLILLSFKPHNDA